MTRRTHDRLATAQALANRTGDTVRVFVRDDQGRVVKVFVEPEELGEAA